MSLNSLSHTNGLPNTRMTHSLSTPSGVDGSSLASSGGGKKLAVRVQMLDDSMTMFQVQAKALGKVLFEQVCKQLNLLEEDYFGLEYVASTTGTKYWLDLEKPLNRQVGFSMVDPLLRFCVKFYTPDPAQLEEEYTRYLFCLQIKRDLSTGSLQCNDNTAALMASYIVQASCGDYSYEDYPDHTYLSSYRFVPQQDHAMERRIMENHKKHGGQSPGEADLNLLETARRCELYGMKMHPAKDHEGVPLNLAVAHMGIAVFQGITRINTFSWAKVRKLSFKRKKFLIKLHPEGYGYYKDIVEFFFDCRDECKNFWKKCVENHGFFRCQIVQTLPRRKTKVLSRGSSFRYSGKTQKQIIEFVRGNYVKRQTFQRSQSFRQSSLHTSKRSQSQNAVNTSISAHPLLPIETAADWELRKQSLDSKMPSQMRRGADIAVENRQQGAPTQFNHRQPTIAHVETYQTTTTTMTKNSMADHRRPSQQMDSSLSVTPTATSPQHNIINNVQEAARAHVHQEDRNLVNSARSHHYATIPSTRVNNSSTTRYQRPQHLVDRSNSTLENEVSSTSHESIPIQRQDITRRYLPQAEDQSMEVNVTSMHRYSTTSACSMSKQDVSTATDLSDDEDIDNMVIYSDINDLHKQQNNTQTIQTQTSTDNYERADIELDDDDDEIQPYATRLSLQNMTTTPSRQPFLVNASDLYATVDRKAKTKAMKQPLLTTDDGPGSTKIRPRNYSSEFIDNSIRNINNVLNSIENYQYQASLNYDGGRMPDFYNSKNVANAESSLFHSPYSHSDHYLSYATANNSMSLRPTTTNIDASGVESVDSYDSHYLTHSSGNLVDNNNSKLLYATIMKPEKNSHFYERMKNDSDRMEYEMTNYSTLQYPSSNDNQNIENEDEEKENDDEKESWQKSASCRELYDYDYDEYKKPDYGYAIGDREFLTTDRIDSPVTRYDDDFRRSNYETHRKYSMDNFEDIDNLPESKVYSSSYPGTTYNTIDQNFKRGAPYSQYEFNEFNGSQDLSHDSYELLEKSDEDFYYRFKNNAADHHARSCSLDSGNFIPTDYESDEEKYAYMKYRNEFKSRSAADIMNDIFLLDDPRDLPKEKLCVKSDGSFYKHVKEAMGTRTSSQESDLYESKNSKSSSLSKKSKDSVYHTDSKKSTKSKSGSDYNGSSPEEIFLVGELLNRKNYEMPTTTAKKTRSLKKLFESNLRNSSNQELKSETFESKSKDANQIKKMSHENLTSDSVQSSFDNQIHFSTFPSNNKHASTSTTRTSHVQSISLQNVEVERNAKTYSAFKSSRENTPTVLNTNSSKKTHIWPEEIEGLQTEISGERNSRGSGRKRSNGENNIFSFDKDKIESMTSSQSTENIAFETTEKIRKSPDYPLTPELLSEYDKQKIESPNNLKPKNRKEELMAKTHFEEYNPKLVLDQKMQIPASMPYPHATVERTKSDPNSLALANRPRLTVNSRRHTLMHQKSIDLTPADSSEDEYLYRQIPSAPAVCHNHGATHFELPQSYDPQLGQIDFPNLPSAGFEMPQTFFKEYEKRAMRDEIPYVLHKRHIMNGTAPSPMRLPPKPRSPKSPKSPRSPKSPKSPRSPKEQKTLQDFLFTKNVDLSKVDIDTLEKNKEEISHIPSPKRSDISKRLDPKVLETLNSKLSQIESDSATSSNSIPKFVVKKPEFIVAHKIDPSTIKKEAIMSGKRAVKPRSGQMKNKNNFKNRSKAKTRITSFSSDDESIDSDDVFGSAEAMPTKMEFSPPQSRKEIEPILKHEHKISQAAWARGQTMSSTEVEGSPPQCRKLADLENRYHTHKLDTNFMTSTELRRISERSISIPSSDDGDADGGSTLKCELATEIYRTTENLAEIEDLEEEEQVMKKDMEENEKFKALTNRDIPPKSKAKLLEEIIDSSMIIRSKGHAPVLFAHARLNLSEGSALTPLQRQEACNDSPTRRAKSLDTPVISLHRLPPMNAFSSKDDTVEFEEEAETLEVKKLDLKIDDDFLVCEKSLSPIDSKSLCEPPIVIEEDEIELLDRLKYIEKITLQGVKIKEKRKSKTQLKSGNQLILDIPKYKFDPLSSGNSSLKTSPAVSRTSSIESRSTRQNNATSPNKFKRAPLKPDSKKSPSKVADNSKLSVPGDNLKSCKEKSKSLEKIGSNKLSAPRGRKSITEETELEKLKRKERQQMLYESAMKQTINMLSPVKDQLPAFPQSSEIEQKEAKKEVDKKIIDNAIKSLPQDCVLIAKSPRKLDSHLAKFSRSCEESKSIEKIDKANRSFDDRNKNSELEDSEKSDNPEDTPSTIQRKILETKEEIKAHIEGTVVHKMISGKSQSLEKKKDDTKSLDFRSKTKSLDNYYDAVDPSFKQEMIDKKNSMLDNEKRKEISSDKRNVTKTSSVDLLKNEKHKIERCQVSHPETYNSDEMQAIISERRSLDLMKRSISKASEVDEKSESSLTSVSEVKTDDINLFPRIPTIECEEPSIEEDESRRNEQMKPDIIRSVESTDDLADLTRCTDEKIKQDQLAYQASSRRSFLKLNIEKSRSSDTASSEREIAERKESSSTSNSNKEKTSIEEESSVSCSIAKPLGISQDFVDPNDEMHCNKLRDRMLKLEEFGTEFHRIPKKSSPSLEKQIPIDLGSGSELDTTDPVEDRIARILQRDESDSGSERKQKPKIQKPPRDLSLHKKVTRAIPIEDLSQPPEKLQAKLNNAHKFLRATNSESSFESKSSMDSRESRDETESSSGSLGIAQRRGELAQRQMRTTWKSFPIESSGSSNENDNWNPEHETYEKYENVESYSDRDDHKESDSEIQDDGGEYQQASQSSNYQDHSSSISSNPIDVLGYGTGYAIGRTLSRISERSTNSEKSDNEEEKTSIDEDITAHEEQEVEEEQSIASSDHQASMSSEIHTNSQQAYVSDTDRRTSAEMPDIPCDSAAAERLTELYKQSITKSGRFSVQNLSEKDKLKAEFIAGSGSSQESCEDWPLPDIPDIETNPAFIMKDRPIPKIFMWRDSISGVQAEHSTDDNWPSPPDSPVEDEDVVETVYLSEPQNPQQVMVESFTETNQDEDDEPDYAEVAEIAPDLPKRDYEFSEPVSPTTIESKTSPTVSIILPYDDTSYMTKEPKPQTDQKGCFDTQVASVGCLKSTLRICSSQNKLSGIAPRIASPDKVIIHQPTRSTSSLQSPMSEEEFFMCDEVFSPGTVKIEISSDERRYSETSLGKFPRSSNNSDTSISIDDLFTGSLLDDSQRRSSGSLEPRRLSSGSCKKCSGGSHSEEETSSFGSNHDGTVKMGIPKKCTHSSHSEDTSIGVSLSEWSTGTNTVRQYANLSGSDTLSAVSNPSAHKSNNTKSSVSSINKSTESLNEKSMSLSCGKNIDIEFYENMSKDPNSDTDKVTSSGTNDESTLTLTEMVHSITEWSTSTSGTLVEQDMNKQQQMDYKHVDKSKTSIDYMPLKPPKGVKRITTNEKESMPGIHNITKTKVDTSVTQSSASTSKSIHVKIPPKIVDVIEKPRILPKPKVPSPPIDESSDKSSSNGKDKRKVLRMMSEQYKSQEVSSSDFSDKLYTQSEKLSERYQSQEFAPFTPAKPPRGDSKSISKHHSYDDKTLSKSQIREYKTTKVRQSHSFHEHLLSSDLNKIDEEKLSSSTTTHTSETSTENSSPMFQRPGRLAKCSPYYSSSLSSDTPEVHQATIHKPPRKPTMTVKTLQTQSSNDTDSSLDVMANDPSRIRAYRRKKQIPSTKRIKIDRPTELESSENSEGYHQNSSGSETAKMYPDFEEEPENIPEDYEDYNYRIESSNVASYPSTSTSAKFETLDLSENVDEMGFPRYDRLRNMTNPPTAMSSFKPPVKPVRAKKKGKIAGVHYGGQDSGSGSESKGGLSDDVCYSSEDSFVAAYNKQKVQQAAGHYVKNVELPYPDFLSDCEESGKRSNNESEKSLDSDDDDEMKRNRKATKKF